MIVNEKIIIGAGLSGLITASLIPDATILESNGATNPSTHKALLRFRSEEVSRATGVPFRRVTVRKAIYAEGDTYGHATPRLANLYARKVTGRVSGDRSIWNLDAVDRWIAPEDFQQQLIERHVRRIKWATPVTDIPFGQDRFTYINTAPLPVMLAACGLVTDEALKFDHSAIRVDRYRLPPGTDIHQTIYYPSPDLRVYRASITGDLMIVESVSNERATATDREELGLIAHSFGFSLRECEQLEQVAQKYGKIVDISRTDREALLHKLSTDFNVFSVGRFACWRNILLDDVVKDIGLVQRLITASSYNRAMVLAKR